MEKQENLRFEFVEMLFALAIGQVAVDLGDLIFKGINVYDNPQIYSHLVLATMIITLSWVGWQKSQSHGNILSINSIYSLQFLILLVDLFLVICYFIMVRGVDYNTSADGKIIPTTDIKIELFWTIIIFITYAVWDILTKYFDFDVVLKGSDYHRVRKYNGIDYIKRAWQTWACILIAIVIYNLYYNKSLNNWQACIIDVMLVSLYTLFRGMKAINLDLSKKPKLEKYEFTKAVTDKLALQGVSYPLEVVDKSYWLKIFFAVILPLLLLISGIIILNYL